MAPKAWFSESFDRGIGVSSWAGPCFERFTNRLPQRHASTRRQGELAERQVISNLRLRKTSQGALFVLRIVAALFAIALLSTPMAAQAQATLDEARAYVKAALPDLPKGIPGYDINDRPVGWDEMILDTRQDSIQDLRLTPYGGYVIALACDQDCRGMGVEVFDHLGQSIGGAHGSTKLAFAFNGGGLMHLRIWISACDQPQCYLAYNVIQLD